jgi:uncharacterized protein (TIGR02246 family)
MNEQELLRRLLDIEEIKHLKARYFRTLDDKDWDGFAQVFTEDAVLENPEVDRVHHGREAIKEAVSAELVGTRTVHHGHMPELDITGPDTASGVWAMFDYVERPISEDGNRSGIRGYGHYFEEYIRQDGEWHIAKLRLTRLRVDRLSD